MATELQERCWRAWWEELAPAEREYWHNTARRPYLTTEQARLLRAEGLPLVTIHSTVTTTSTTTSTTTATTTATTTERVLFPVDLADLLEQDAADR